MHYPNSFRLPPPPLSNGYCGKLFSDPIFSSGLWHCRNELNSAQTILSSLLTPPTKRNCPLALGRGKKVSQTIQVGFYNLPPPLPLRGNAHILYMETKHLKKGFLNLGPMNMREISEWNIYSNTLGQKFQKVENEENRFFAITSSKLVINWFCKKHLWIYEFSQFVAKNIAI